MTEIITPWYKQFWPWFIFALPASVVVAGVITVVIAFKYADSVVADNYYKDGLGINQELAQDKVAESLQLTARVVVDDLTGEVRVVINGQEKIGITQLQMDWFHPINKEQDFVLILKSTPDKQYLGQLQQAISGRWYVQLAGLEPKPWRLKTEVNMKDGRTFSLGQDVGHIDGS